MKREIKFRFWAEAQQQMIYFTPWQQAGQDHYENWQEFTGLYDKDQRPIYEGDIVENEAIRSEVIQDKGVWTLLLSQEDKFKVKQPLAVHEGLKVIGQAIYK